MRLLLVEDDVRVAGALAAGLRRRGYLVEHVETVAAALAAGPVDLVLLDLNLPDGDGLTVCRTLRAASPGIGIIVLTARSEERDRVVGLRTGADDYVVKPFSMAELQARIEAVLRRATWVAPPSSVLSFGPLTIDVAAREVHYDGRLVALTRKEFDVLLSLARQPGVAVPRDRILMDVWQTTWRGGHTLEVHIGSLRSKLGADDLVQTVRGVGYRLKAG
ncbi:response regulator transcription factor [Micromonospora zhanjiangensis]|uniref:Response regulator transcription factor n=1 Tax=Micromonospora zhanjiangensis TaxID=1522057 RepID=A0ABV8KSL3_9ACTN